MEIKANGSFHSLTAIQTLEQLTSAILAQRKD